MSVEIKKAGIRLIGLACAVLVVLFSSCSSDDDQKPEPYKTGEEAVATFRKYFYNQGNVNAIKLDDFLETEWAIPIDQAGKACELFTRLTGMEAALSDKYSYSYQSADGKCAIRIEGKEIPEDAVYAVMYINIPECPDFSKVILAKPEYFEGTNAGGYIDII